MFQFKNRYAASCDPEDVLAAVQKNQMEYFPADVLLRGRYPGYAYRFFRDNNIHVKFYEGDEDALKNTADFFSFSYYYTRVCSKESFENGNSAFRNPKLPQNPWGWTIDPIGLRIQLNNGRIDSDKKRQCYRKRFKSMECDYASGIEECNPEFLVFI